MRLRGNSITASNVNSGIMNNNTNNHHDNNNGEERPSHFSNYYGGSKPPDVSSSSTPKRRTTGRRKSSFTAKLFSSSKPTNNNNHNESSQQQHNREMLFSADGMLPDPRCEMRAMIECQQQQQHQQQRSEYYPQQQQLKPGVYAANNNNVSAAERLKYGDGHNNIPQNRAAEEVTEHNDDTHHHEHDDIIAVTNSANRFKFGIQQLQQYDIRRGSGGSVSTLTKSSAGEETFHTPSPPGTTAAAAAVTATNRNLMIGKSPFANYKIDDDNDENCDDHDDGGGRQPYTRPSCPQYKRTTNMGLSTPAAATTSTSGSSCSNMNNGYCAFDVNATRAELLSKLEGKRRGGGGGGPTLKCSTVQEIDEDLLRERESTPSSSFFTQTQTSPPPEFRGSLRDCLIGMGFDDDAIIKAMVACNASESKDVENVIEWLDDHREVVGVGEGVVVRSSDDAYYHHHDINNNNNNKINHESFCDEESHYTQTSLHTRTSHGTAQTEESNEEIRILAHSLKDLGFDHVEIREKKELYRRASKNNGLLNAEGFIAAMFEVDDEIVGSSSSSSRVVKSRVKSEPLLARDDNDDDGNDWKRSASLSHHRKQRNQTDSELFSFLSAMGFSMEKIESAIQSLRNEGTNDIIDAEAVVAVLLSQQHEEKSRSSSVGALLPLVTIDNSHGGCSKSTADELEQNEFMKIEVTPGNFAPVLKARQTVQAISDGTAVSVRCTVCSVTLQCCPDAEYVLCPDCDVVSPILSQYRRLASSDRVAGSDGSSSQSSHHSARSNRRMSTGGMIGAIGLGKKSRR